MSTMMQTTGLDDVVAAQTRLSSVDGKAGELVIAGFPLNEIANNATFEEMAYLLWHDELPNTEQLTQFRRELTQFRAVDPLGAYVAEAAAHAKADPMDALRMAASTILPANDDQATAKKIMAQLPTLVAVYWRTLQNLPIIEPRQDLSHAANYLWMLNGTEPTPEQTRALETYLNTVSDHGLNASTFTARVIISTQSDLVSAIVGAIGALKGPLHGGAPGPALEMVFEIGQAERAEAVIRAKLERGERLMGFGHRVYKVRDPRADALAQAAQHLYANDQSNELYNLVTSVEQTALKLLDEYKPGRNLRTNVEFYTAFLLHSLGLPTAMFTPTFTLGRAAGWIAHCFEQQATGRLIRPQSEYIGTKDRKWVNVGDRR